jgi:fimbrial chaperone protein
MCQNIFGRVIIAFVLLGFSLLAEANAFNVWPIKIDLSAKTSIITFQVTNQSDSATTLQSSVAKWTQDHLTDVYQPTQDVIIIPPLARIAPHQTQLFRVALQKPSSKKIETAYRVYLQEVLPPATSKQFELRVATRLGLPTFVQTETPASTKYDWQLQQLANGEWAIAMTNNATQHIYVANFVLSSTKTHTVLAKQDAYTYILPGSSRQWVFKPQQAISLPLTLAVTTKDGTITAAITQIVHRKA